MIESHRQLSLYISIPDVIFQLKIFSLSIRNGNSGVIVIGKQQHPSMLSKHRHDRKTLYSKYYGARSFAG